MRMVIVSVYDEAVGAFGRPAFVRSESEAVRAFSDEVNRPAADNPMTAHPEHFTLWFVGYFDDNDGTFSTGDAHCPRSLVRAGDLRTKPG